MIRINSDFLKYILVQCRFKRERVNHHKKVEVIINAFVSVNKGRKLQVKVTFRTSKVEKPDTHLLLI